MVKLLTLTLRLRSRKCEASSSSEQANKTIDARRRSLTPKQISISVPNKAARNAQDSRQ